MTTATATHPRKAAPPRTSEHDRRTQSLGSYAALETEQTREVVVIERPDGSALVVDYQLGTLTDGRLVAHLSPDEPPQNARIVCDLYLADDTGRCRTVTPEDFEITHRVAPSRSIGLPTPAVPLSDARGHIYRLRALPADASAPELRWTRARHSGDEDAFDVVTLRDVVGCLEAYEPARAMTTDALADSDANVSSRRLREELQRLVGSPIVLNRALRVAVQRELKLGVLSLSEIALRCGRVKRDQRGNASGETSWLGRRIGQLPESGSSEPCPWIHTDVLALIAREGLDVSPHEVEL
jgi:hypothetical protein